MAPLLALFSVTGAVAARPVALITDYNRIRVTNLEQNEQAYGQFGQFLIDRNPNTYFHSNYSYGAPEHGASAALDAFGSLTQIEVHLEKPTDPSRKLYIYRQARSYATNGTPTQFRVDASRDGVTWDTGLQLVDIPFNNVNGGENFSGGFTLPAGYNWLRFVCTKNSGGVNTKGVPYVVMAEFQVYESDDDLSRLNNEKSLWMADEAHTIFDYQDTYRDFRLEHTRGVVNSLNHDTNSLRGWCDWSKWQNGTWTDTLELKKDGIEMPDFTYINKQTAPFGRVELGDRQRTHVTEHTVYAIPGQVTSLYPFSDIHNTVAYHDTYSRWYDYRTDGNNKYLDFLHDPSSMSRTETMGYLGGTYMSNGATELYDVYIYTVDDYIRFRDRVNSGETRLTARQCADLDFSGVTDMVPIGIDENNAFRGVYDGNGYAIVNLHINRPDWDCVGIFGHVGAAIIRNLHVNYSSISARNMVGFIGAVNAAEYMDQNTGGALLVHNVSVKADIRASGKNAGGILGCNNRWTSQFQIFIANCAVLGSVSGAEESGSVSGWLGKLATVRDTYNAATISGAVDKETSFVRAYKNGAGKDMVCLYNHVFDNNGGNSLSALPHALDSGNLVEDMGGEDEWRIGGWSYVIPKARDCERFGNRARGSFATFYCPADENFTTQYIAVDFSQTFDIKRHVDFEKKVITEPIVAFRHIFRVENAYTLAEQVSGSPANNEKYVSENRRTIRARAGADFQIRFEIPQPMDQDTRTTMFYKDPQGAVRRVRKSKIQVTDRDGNDRSGIFYQIADYTRPEPRKLPTGDNPLDFYDAGKRYARSMKCDAANANGRFTVHLVACDENGNELKIYGSDKPLILAEWIVNFVDIEGAAMTSEAEMATDKYEHTRPSSLQEKYGEPIAVVNFDEYRFLDRLSNRTDYMFDGAEIPESGGVRAHKYKWPVPWGNSQYAYGYDDPEDYNMYMIADHSLVTPYHGAADEGTMAENFNKGLGRFDRLFYDTEGRDKGFFYYVNAASDPGVMASLQTDDLCPGSTLFVSAWVAEFSKNYNQYANLVFNFKVVQKDGTEHILHSFVTGYVPRETLGQWQHVYYQFTPNLSQLGISAEDILSYQLVLENNCISSSGADYAIDDVRVYVARPRVYAEQTMPLCKGEQGTDVQVQTPFDVMLATLGVSEASTSATGATVDCYYTFVDKEKYEKALADGLDGNSAYEHGVVRYEYMAGGGDDQTFGHLTFSTHFRSNREFEDGFSDVTTEAMRTIIDGDRYLVINTCPRDKNLVPGKEYMVVLYVSERGDEGIVAPDASAFAIGSKCCKSSTFRIHASGVIKIDGIMVPNLDNITVCENQTPVVQIDIQGKENKSGDFVGVAENVLIDWWDGSMEDYISQTDEVTGLPLYTIMTRFRGEYPEADTWDVPAKGYYTEAMRDYLSMLTTVDEEAGKPARLLLYRSSYVFRPVRMNPGQEETYVYAVAIPIDIYSDEVTVCTTPSEVRLRVRNNSPALNHGFAGGDISYPEWIDDVPLRIGLRQLRDVSVADVDNVIGSQHSLLSIPLRMVSTVTEGVDALEKIPEDYSVYLVETDDPEYLDLNVETVNGEPQGLYPMGALREIVAVPGDGRTDNVIRMAFDSDFSFKEGHTYRLRFSFRENGVPSLPTGSEPGEELRPCFGQHVFSLKVVPEYQEWAPADGNANWNNDANWRRVSTADLLHETRTGDETINPFVTDRGELTSTSRSFVPMDFTKVIVPAGETPQLYAAPRSLEVTVDGRKYLWPASLTAPDGTGDYTADIIYDMASLSLDGGKGVACRPWYTNTCDQIHFRSNAEILNQSQLSHNRAWVDMEIAPDMWYTLSSPLTSVVAGDMYLPTAGARQMTELFVPITFDITLHNRFAPAVYQRSWNQARATVYELGGGADGRNVAVRTTWSHVYNDVDESYGSPATGYSIKADVSRAQMGADDPELVMFRLPKDDRSFVYFDDVTGATGHETAISRGESKLHSAEGGVLTCSVSGASEGRYFLVGNPFMAHLDMARFLEDNAGVINPKYWILNGEGQGSAVYDADSGSFVTTFADAGLVPPMQGFFVEAKSETLSLTLGFDESNTIVVPYDPTAGNLLRVPSLAVSDDATRGADYGGALRISAVRGGAVVSQAVVALATGSSEDYGDSEDAALIIDSNQAGVPRVYTVAGDMAASVNLLPEVVTTEVGLMAEAGENVTLRFDGSDLGGALLYDAHLGTTVPIERGMEYDVTGAVESRFYIVSGVEEDFADDAIRVNVIGREVTVTVPDNGYGVAARVCDMSGLTVHTGSESGNMMNFTLEPGVYVVEAYNGTLSSRRIKIQVR